jgi:hypothetical protein
MLGLSSAGLARPLAAEEPFRGVVEWVHQLGVGSSRVISAGLVEAGDYGNGPHEFTADAEVRQIITPSVQLAWGIPSRAPSAPATSFCSASSSGCGPGGGGAGPAGPGNLRPVLDHTDAGAEHVACQGRIGNRYALDPARQ